MSCDCKVTCPSFTSYLCGSRAPEGVKAVEPYIIPALALIVLIGCAGLIAYGIQNPITNELKLIIGIVCGAFIPVFLSFFFEKVPEKQMLLEEQHIQ